MAPSRYWSRRILPRDLWAFCPSTQPAAAVPMRTHVVVRKESLMLIHGPSSLRGPVTQSHDCWARRSEIVSPDQPFRKELIAKVRAEISAGTYDTPERFEAAFAKLLDRHFFA